MRYANKLDFDGLLSLLRFRRNFSVCREKQSESKACYDSSFSFWKVSSPCNKSVRDLRGNLILRSIALVKFYSDFSDRPFSWKLQIRTEKRRWCQKQWADNSRRSDFNDFLRPRLLLEHYWHCVQFWMLKVSIFLFQTGRKWAFLVYIFLGPSFVMKDLLSVFKSEHLSLTNGHLREPRQITDKPDFCDLEFVTWCAFLFSVSGCFSRPEENRWKSNYKRILSLDHREVTWMGCFCVPTRPWMHNWSRKRSLCMKNKKERM